MPNFALQRFLSTSSESTAPHTSSRMQAAMPTSPRSAEWKPAHAPRHSYRSSAAAESLQSPTVAKSPVVEEGPRSADSEAKPKTSSSTGRPAASGNTLRPTGSRDSDRTSHYPKSPVSSAVQKKRSLFGGLFVSKEPTALALERLAAQLEAQHGELSARAIPGVSSSKLPQHVPKVNTKWDGVPEVLKEREKLLKEKARAAKRQSLAPSTRSRSVEGSRPRNARPGERRPLQNRSSSSTLSSFDSRGRAGQQRNSQFGGSDEIRSPSKTPSSDPDRGRTIVQAASTKSQSLRSPSGSSLPRITAFFPSNIPSQPAVPARFKSASSHTVGSQTTTSTGQTRVEPAESTIAAVPEHSSSPTGTPLDRSPVTPSPIAQHHSSEPSILSNWNRADETIFVAAAADVPAHVATAPVRRKDELPRDAFLAGEARPFELPDDQIGPGPAVNSSESDLPLRRSPERKSKATAPELPAHARVQQDLEKRPDSSRARLGLRASMLVREDQAPWDWQDFEKGSDSGRSTSARLSMPAVPKSLSKVLGKANK